MQKNFESEQKKQIRTAASTGAKVAHALRWTALVALEHSVSQLVSCLSRGCACASAALVAAAAAVTNVPSSVQTKKKAKKQQAVLRSQTA